MIELPDLAFPGRVFQASGQARVQYFFEPELFFDTIPDWAKSKYDVDEVTVAAPPSWLAAMPDCLSMPDGSATGHDYIGRMSLVVSERACVVKA